MWGPYSFFDGSVPNFSVVWTGFNANLDHKIIPKVITEMLKRKFNNMNKLILTRYINKIK